MTTACKQWWSMLPETERQKILAAYAIKPGTTLGRECFSYGLVNSHLPAFALRVVETAYSQLPAVPA